MSKAQTAPIFSVITKGNVLELHAYNYPGYSCKELLPASGMFESILGAFPLLYKGLSGKMLLPESPANFMFTDRSLGKRVTMVPTLPVIAVIALLLRAGVHAQGVLSSGSGFGTYYYDINQIDACGTSFVSQNKGPVECSLMTALTLNDVNSNYLVAVNHTLLAGNLSKYCGRRIVVSIDGQPSNLPLFVGDGCQRCAGQSAQTDIWDASGAPGLDFSYSVLKELSTRACDDGHIPITWEIVEEKLYNFDTDGSGGPQGPITVANQEMATMPVISAPISSISSSLVPEGSSMRNSQTAICSTGAWRCERNALEQCLAGSWVPRATCGEEMTCRGDSNPYCTL